MISMSHTSISADDLRARFSEAMSNMYRREVPLYGDLLEIVAACNDKHPHGGDVSRLPVERHGAIRLGTPAELHTMRRVLAVLGLEPVGYYDLAQAGVPVHSTAFRPVGEAALSGSPFRLFTSLLRLDLIQDRPLREEAGRILARRRIFSDRLLELVDRHEHHGSLDADEAQEFLAQALETFRWHRQATVSRATYDALHSAHRLIADVVCFKGPHINHLTPRTSDIDAVQAEMRRRGIDTKRVIEGPPTRRHPILLRQTSFKALEETVQFAGDAAGAPGSHTARFGEVEQRGMALTPKGRALYDHLLAQAGTQSLEEVFRAFPDDLATLRTDGLAFFRYTLADPQAATSHIPDHEDVELLLKRGTLRAEPVMYEDFLPVSAAGIFQSNLGAVPSIRYNAGAARAEFEEALGRPVLDEMAIYEEQQTASLRAALAALGRIETA
jgi:uncharacterized glyoxalase superfamily metalloenzyme YdcJ